MKDGENLYYGLITAIRQLVEQSRASIAKAINTELLFTYWYIGRLIVEFEQRGNIRADYGSHLLIGLSKSLTIDIGKGFSRLNLQTMRLFYLTFLVDQKSQTLSGKFLKSPNEKSQTVSGKSQEISSRLNGDLETQRVVSQSLTWSHNKEDFRERIRELLSN